MIHEILPAGRENALSGRALATMFNCDIRAITVQIEKERREGQPICAASGDNPGYYLAADPDELKNYCDRQLQAAIDTVSEIMTNEDNNAAVRLQAAQTILNNAGKFAQRLQADETGVIVQIESNKFNPLY